MSNHLRHNSILFLLAIVFAMAEFGAFANVSLAITAQDQAYINERVALNPLVRELTEYVQAAQVEVQNAENKVTQATAAVVPVQNAYNTALSALNAFVPDPLLSETENNSAKQQLQNAVNAAAIPLAQKKQLLANAQAALSTAQQALADAQQALADAKGEATTEATQALQTQQNTQNIGSGIGGVTGTAQTGIQATEALTSGEPQTPSITTTGITASNQSSKNQTGISEIQIPPLPTPLTAEEQRLAGTIKPCGKLDILCNIATLPFRIIYVPTSWMLWVAGYIFDATITLSIDKFYVDQTFVALTWTTVRDFSNMLFIFILLYTGIMTILGKIDWRKTVLNVIIIALLINFSLFFTKVVIDAGNILSAGIFQAMGAAKESGGMLVSGGDRIQERDLSQAIVANFQPAKFLSVGGSAGTWGAIAVFIVASIINVFASYVLFKAALLFIGRLLAFWFLMIISPFAFISFVLPKGNIFSWWLRTLLSQSFVAPVFLFLLYLVMTVISTGNLITSFTNVSGAFGEKFLFASLLGPILITAMLISALKYILKITEDMAESFGSMASEYAGKALGFAAGGVVGGVGRQVIGGLAAQTLKKGWVAPGGAAAGVAKYLTKSSFDVRNVGGVVGGAVETVTGKVFGEYTGELAGKWAGGKVTQGVGTLGVGAGTGAGGVAATEKAKAQWQRAKEAKERNKAEIPILKAKLATMISDHTALKARNGDTATTQGTVLRTELTTAEASLLSADLARQGNPSDPTLQTNYVAALADKKTKEKTFEKYDKGQEKIEKLEKQIEAYENL